MKHPTSLSFYFLTCFVCLVAAAQHAAPPVANCASEPQQTAQGLFNLWVGSKSTQPFRISTNPKNDNTTAVLAQLGQLLPGETCIFLYQWDPASGLHFEPLESHHCHTNALQWKANNVLLYQRWLQHAISQHAADGHLRHKFHFYVDLSDGHRHSPGLAEALGAPILVQSKWSGDNYSIPIPSSHWAAGQLLNLGVAVPEAEALQKRAAEAYNTTASPAPLPWADRAPSLTYRACCQPTVDTRTISTPPFHVYPLGDLCTATHDLPGFDVSVSLCRLMHACEQGLFQPLCDGCLNCVQHRSRIPRARRGTFRYQLAAPGPSPTGDPTLQQLLTSSAVMALQPEAADGRPLQLHQQWYTPLLQDRIHYLLTTAKQLPATKKWCDENSDACRQVAEAGRHVAACDVTAKAGLQYTYLVLKHIHDLVASQ